MGYRKWLAIFLTVVMILALFPVVGFADEHANCVTLYAGQNIEVGTVCVSNDGDYIYVKYCIDDGNWDDGEGWGIYETHVQVGEALDDFPLNRGGNPQIGHFDYKKTHEGVQCYTEMIPLGDWETDNELLIAAHTVVKKVECVTDEYTPELSWQRSSEENAFKSSGYGANWNLADGFDIDTTVTEAVYVWDGGTDYQNDLRAGVNADISYATWQYASNDGGSHNDFADLRRFQATFDIPDGYTITGGRLESVNDGYDNQIPINDNIYIFINENLQFWGGTIINKQGSTLFEGMSGVEAIRGGVVGARDPAETDGWYIPGTIPDIDDNDFLVGGNVLDVFAEEFSLWGAMHELGLTLEYKECVWEEETAWGAGTRFVERGNWATYFYYTVKEPVDEFTVDSSDSNGTDSSIMLENGVNYRIKVSGTWSNKPDDPHLVDAKYISFDNWNTYSDAYPGRADTLLELMVDEGFVDWGDFNSDHIYYWDIVGEGGKVNLSVYDTYYGDNVGSFNVKIYRIW